MMKRQKRPHVRKNPALGAQHLNALAPTRTSTPNDGSVNTLSDKEGSDKNGKVPKQVENISKNHEEQPNEVSFLHKHRLDLREFC